VALATNRRAAMPAGPMPQAHKVYHPVHAAACIATESRYGSVLLAGWADRPRTLKCGSWWRPRNGIIVA
jgi:hypothetical protein